MPTPQLDLTAEEHRLILLHRARAKQGHGDLTLHYQRGRIAKTTWTEKAEWQREAGQKQLAITEGGKG